MRDEAEVKSEYSEKDFGKISLEEFTPEDIVQKYVNAMAKFGITTFYYKPGMRLTKPSKAIVFREDSHHRAHLHCGATKITITEIKE